MMKGCNGCRVRMEYLNPMGEKDWPKVHWRPQTMVSAIVSAGRPGSDGNCTLLDEAAHLPVVADVLVPVKVSVPIGGGKSMVVVPVTISIGSLSNTTGRTSIW